MNNFLGYMLLFGAGLMSTATAQQDMDRVRLMNALFQNYNRDLLPFYDRTNDVRVGMSLSSIRGLDLFEGTIVMNAWMPMSWRDPRLSWEPSATNITKLRVPTSDIWTPDITLYNGNSPVTYMMPDMSVLLYHNGEVTYVPIVQIDATCTLDLKDYPYDSHNCSLKWGSWSYDSDRVSVTPQSHDIDTSRIGAMSHPIWDIIDTNVIKHTLTYPCCPEAYEDITFSVTVRRRETHGRIASSVITTWLILVVFLIGPTSAGKRIFFAGFIFVALVVLSASLSAEIPGYSMTRLGRFIIVGMMVVAIVTVYNGIIYRFYPKEKPGQLVEGDGSASRALLVIDIGAFLGIAVILGVSSGALFM